MSWLTNVNELSYTQKDNGRYKINKINPFDQKERTVLANYPNVQVATVGGAITDLKIYTGTNDLPSFVPNAMNGEFWESRKLLDRYIERSPIFEMKTIDTPTLMQYGENDQRVPYTQGKEFYRALQRKGVDSRLQVYPKTGHTIHNPQLLYQATKTNYQWTKTHMPAHDDLK